MKSLSLRTAAIALACAVLLNGAVVVALAATSVGITGYEIFPGIRLGPVNYGTTFIGRTDAGGSWAAAVNYTGTPGIGGRATIVGGAWALRNPDRTLFGRVSSGTVVWPDSLTTTVPGSSCGAGIAAFTATLSNGGSIVGCLDDTHLATVFPPTIVGTLTLP